MSAAEYLKCHFFPQQVDQIEVHSVNYVKYIYLVLWKKKATKC
jgi:hypothetical protein